MRDVPPSAIVCSGWCFQQTLCRCCWCFCFLCLRQGCGLGKARWFAFWSLLTEKPAMSFSHWASTVHGGGCPDTLSMVSTNTTSLSASLWFWAWLPGQNKLLQILLGPGKWIFTAFLRHRSYRYSDPIIKRQQNRPKTLDISSSCNHNLMLRKWDWKEEFTESFHLFLTWYFLSLIALHTVQQQFWLYKSMVCCG